MGGGTGGLAVATRLSEDPTISVAVVEAGEFYEIANGNISQVPGLDVTYAYPSGSTPPLVDWGFTTEPQKVFAAKPLFLTLLVDLNPDTVFSP